MKSLFFCLFTLLTVNLHTAYAQKSSKIMQVNTDYQKGTLTGGYKSGVWQYFDKPGELSLKVDYDLGKVTFMRRDSVGMYAIEKDGNWVQSALDIQPRYLGSMMEFYRILMSNIRYPAEARRNSNTGTLYLMFEVDTTGQAVNHQILDDLGDRCGEEVLRAFALILNLWTVATKEQNLYRSRIILPVTFNITLNGRQVSEGSKKRNQPELPISRELSELVIKAMGVSRTPIHN
jgi:hypothetical protein